jgi:hypothetical protein
LQAIFKESRETLLRIGTMRFVDSLVTERPLPPARALRVTNDAYSLAFRFGVDDEILASPEERHSSIAPLPFLQMDTRAADGKLGIFQSTPAGIRSARRRCNVRLLILVKDTPLARSLCSNCFSTLKLSHAPPPARWAYVFAWHCAITTVTFHCVAGHTAHCTR